MEQSNYDAEQIHHIVLMAFDGAKIRKKSDISSITEKKH